MSDDELLQAQASRSFGDRYRVKFVSAYDGDTFLINVASWHPLCGERMPVRIHGIDAPEIKDNRPDIAAIGLKAKFRLADILKSGSITLKDMRRDKYFRILAYVYVGGKNVGDVLNAEGLTRPYYGIGPRPW